MKIILAILAVGIVGVLILGFLFVQWANRPENVEAFKKKKEADATQKAGNEKKRAELEKEIETKRANLKLVIDENFVADRFDFLDYKFDYSFFKVENHEFRYRVTTYSKDSPQQFFIFSKDDFEDFAAEMEFEIWGREAETGIFWDAQPNGENDPKKFQAAYSTPNGLYVEAAGDSDDFNLGSFFEALTTQKMRVERFGNFLKVSVNDKIIFDKMLAETGPGKVGIYIGHRGGLSDNTSSLIVNIKNFKVWK